MIVGTARLAWLSVPIPEGSIVLFHVWLVSSMVLLRIPPEKFLVLMRYCRAMRFLWFVMKGRSIDVVGVNFEAGRSWRCLSFPFSITSIRVLGFQGWNKHVSMSFGCRPLKNLEMWYKRQKSRSYVSQFPSKISICRVRLITGIVSMGYVHLGEELAS